MKGLIDFFVDRYRTTLTMMFLVLTWGIFSYGQIPNASEPDIDVPFVMVSTFYEGVSPEDAERLISRPLEKRLLTVDDVKGVQSCLLYTSPSPRDWTISRMPSSA